MKNKKDARLRRARKCRAIIKQQRIARLCVYRTPRHLYAQIIAPTGDKVLVSATTTEKVFREANKQTGNVAAATQLGKQLADRAKKAKIVKVAFDRSGFMFHGRVKALAEAARAGGLEF